MGTAAATGVWGRAEQQDFRSRVRGTLLGAAVGDAFGAPLDGLSLDEIRAAHGTEGLTEPAPAYGRRGAVTAATQLALFTVDDAYAAQVRRDTGAGTRRPTCTAPTAAGPPPRATGDRTSGARRTAGSPARSGSTPAAPRPAPASSGSATP